MAAAREITVRIKVDASEFLSAVESAYRAVGPEGEPEVMSMRTTMLGEPGLLEFDLFGGFRVPGGRFRWTPDAHPSDGVWITPDRALPVAQLTGFMVKQITLQLQQRRSA